MILAKAYEPALKGLKLGCQHSYLRNSFLLHNISPHTRNLRPHSHLTFVSSSSFSSVPLACFSAQTFGKHLRKTTPSSVLEWLSLVLGSMVTKVADSAG